MFLDSRHLEFKDSSSSQIIAKVLRGSTRKRSIKTVLQTNIKHCCLLYTNKTELTTKITNCLFACFLSQEEPKKVSQALAMKLGCTMQGKTTSIQATRGMGVMLPTRRQEGEEQKVFRNKKMNGCPRIEAIRLFLAFASFMGFIVYQMDVKSAFLYGNITEEVYVKQPPGFEDPAHPNKVYRVVKALYGLHQAPRAWYERLSTFLLKHGYRRGAIDKTLFIKKDRRDIMLVQVYVDDIIFGSTKSSMVKDFEDLMQKEFKMSSMGELTFFLGLQVKQTSTGIFLSQDKYVKDILNKFDFRTIKPASTPIEAHKSLGKDEEGEDVDVHLYRSMIGCLMYLTASRPDIMFAVCLCARFQVTPKGTIMIDDQLQEDVNILEEDWSAMQETNNCGYLLYRSRICSSCKLLCSGRNKVQVPYSRAQVLQGCSRHSKLKVLAHSQRTASVQGTASFHGTATTQDSMQFNVRYLTRTAAIKEVKRLKRQTLSQAKQIIKLKAKLKKLSKFVQPVVQHHAFWVENQNLKKQKRRRKKHKKKVSSVKLGRNKDEGTLKSDGLKEVNIEEKEASNVKSGETEELDLETTQSTARQVAEVLVAISRPRGLSIPGPIQSQSQPQQPSQATDPKDKGKGILVEEPKRRIKLFNNQALETYRIMERFLEKFKLNGNARRKKEKSFEEE
ncbi:putative ribonuclease H-like domain-containing protein [Tanacetum coccineum]